MAEKSSDPRTWCRVQSNTNENRDGKTNHACLGVHSEKEPTLYTCVQYIFNSLLMILNRPKIKLNRSHHFFIPRDKKEAVNLDRLTSPPNSI